MLGVPIMLKLVAELLESLEDIKGRMRVGGPSSVIWPFSITRMLSAPFKYLGRKSSVSVLLIYYKWSPGMMGTKKASLFFEQTKNNLQRFVF